MTAGSARATTILATIGAALALAACDATEPEPGPPADIPSGLTEDDGTGEVPPPPMHWSDARALLSDLSAWDAATGPARRAAAEEAGSRLDAFSFESLAWFEAGGERHQIAVFSHARTGLSFCLVPGGVFSMGSPGGEAGRPADDGPLAETLHEVVLTAGYLMASTEVTQAAWRQITGATPAAFPGDTLPVEQVSWEDARTFCTRAGLALPTEAQWEHACRAGTTSAFAHGDDPGELLAFAVLAANAGETTHPVGGRPPNAFGLHDMHGNVLEWCADRDGAYPAGQVTDPRTERDDGDRIARGGSWFNPPAYARSAARSAYPADTRASALGLRPVAPLPE